MKRFLTWVDRLDWLTLGVIAVVMGVLPPGGQPHLFEKLDMLFAGTLARPIDIFDLVLHGSPAALIILKAVRLALIRSGPSGRDSETQG